MENYIIEMENIRKEFPGVVANDNVTLRLKKGEIHALLGENGAGKSTLMSVLFGLYIPEKGVIKKNGEVVNIANPNVANDLGIGMVHQHFKLVHNFTVAENIVLGMEDSKFGFIKMADAIKKITELSEKYKLKIDPTAKIEDITVGMQQRVEILKMLYRNAEILIFDEPTAVLTPQEIEELMKIIRNLIDEGKSIILITHKLNEIKAVADRCTVLRKGKYVDTIDVATTSKEKMAELMVGRKVNFQVDKNPIKLGKPILEVNQDGKIVPFLKVRTQKKALRQMVDIVIEDVKKLEDFVVTYDTSDNLEGLKFIKDEMEKACPGYKYYEAPITPVVGCHTGVGTVGIAYFDLTKK